MEIIKEPIKTCGHLYGVDESLIKPWKSIVANVNIDRVGTY